jgi:hypothetical protein
LALDFDFCTPKKDGIGAQLVADTARKPKETLREKAAAWSRNPACTVSRQGPVDELHSIENTQDRDLRFLLTGKTGRVDSEAFFDSFSSFSGWRRVRGSSQVTVHAFGQGRRAGKGL